MFAIDWIKYQSWSVNITEVNQIKKLIQIGELKIRRSCLLCNRWYHVHEFVQWNYTKKAHRGTD